MENKKRGMKVMAMLSLAILGMMSFASAFGVANLYYGGNPLKLAPGESSDVLLNLQNMVGDQDMTVSLKVSQGSDIASTSDALYTIKKGTSDTFATVQVKVPSDAQIGATYNVGVMVSPVNQNSGGMISVGTAIESSFPVEVVAPKNVEKPAVLSSSTMAVIAVIIVLIVLWILFSLMNKKKRRK